MATKRQGNLGGISESHSSSTERRVKFSFASPSNDIDRARGYDITERLVAHWLTCFEVTGRNINIKSEEGK